MPLWLIVQVGLLLIWYIIAFLVIKTRVWRIGFPLSPKAIEKFILTKFAPIAWLSSSFVFGLGYLFVNLRNSDLIIPLVSLIALPCIVFIFAGRAIWSRYTEASRTDKRESALIASKSKEFYEWVHQFGFLKDEMIEVKIYISKGKPVGRAYIRALTEQQVIEINNHKNDLPEGIYLNTDIYRWNSDHNNTIH